MNKAIPEDSWLKLSEKYLYPKQKTHSQTEKLKAVAPKSVATMAMAKALQESRERGRAVTPFSVMRFKANKDNMNEKYNPVLSERIIKLLKINERHRTAEESR